MGYQVYEDAPARDYGVRRWAGYGVPAICDQPGCTEKIDRGMGYRCEEYFVYPGDADDDYDGPEDVVVEGCQMHFCSEHSEHSDHKGAVPKPDTPEWLRHVLSDESWAEWRAEDARAAQLAWFSIGMFDKVRVLVRRTGVYRRLVMARGRLDDWRYDRIKAKRIKAGAS